MESVQNEPLSSQRYAEKAKNALHTPHLCGSKFTQIHKVGCYLTGCGGMGRGQPYAYILLYILTAAGS